MNELQIFNNIEFGRIRVLEKEGQPWFVGKDICTILEIKNNRDAVARLDDDEKDVVSADTLGGKQNFQAINEYGLYSLVLGSRKPEAKQFKRWITHEVIPTIRKHGAYMTPQTIEETLSNPDFIIQLATKLKEEQELNKKQQQIIGELKPRADYTDRILMNKGLVTITQIAKDYDMSGTEMNKLLHKLKIQYKQSGQWLLYRDYQGKGYTSSQTIEIIRSSGMQDVKLNTKWTQKGRMRLYELLKKNLILPEIEKL